MIQKARSEDYKWVACAPQKPVVRKTPFNSFSPHVTLLHPDRVVKVLSFLLLNVADFKGVQAG
jgi:hypothetical protein